MHHIHWLHLIQPVLLLNNNVIVHCIANGLRNHKFHDMRDEINIRRASKLIEWISTGCCRTVPSWEERIFAAEIINNSKVHVENYETQLTQRPRDSPDSVRKEVWRVIPDVWLSRICYVLFLMNFGWATFMKRDGDRRTRLWWAERRRGVPMASSLRRREEKAFACCVPRIRPRKQWLRSSEFVSRVAGVVAIVMAV